MQREAKRQQKAAEAEKKAAEVARKKEKAEAAKAGFGTTNGLHKAQNVFKVSSAGKHNAAVCICDAEGPC